MIKFPHPVRGIDNGRPYIGGNVELFHDEEWGTICNNVFDRNNNGATILCKMMGYEAGVYSSSYRQTSVTPSTRIWVDDVTCTGKETHIGQCLTKHWGYHNCDHQSAVAIRCYGK